MKIRFEHHGTIFEYERKPLSESRFKALCGIAAAGIYVGMIWVVATLCGFLGVLLAMTATLFGGTIVKGLY